MPSKGSVQDSSNKPANFQEIKRVDLLKDEVVSKSSDLGETTSERAMDSEQTHAGAREEELKARY